MPQLTYIRLQAQSELADELLLKAETAYGPRDPDWKFAGVTEQDGGPFLLYPDDRCAMIALSPGVTDQCQLLYQLSHEVIHVLAPSRQQSDAIMLEEGVAVKFSLDGPAYPLSAYPEIARQRLQNNPEAANYSRALKLLEELEQLRPDAVNALREVEPHFHQMTPALLVEVLSAPAELAEALCERVPMRPR